MYFTAHPPCIREISEKRHGWLLQDSLASGLPLGQSLSGLFANSPKANSCWQITSRTLKPLPHFLEHLTKKMRKKHWNFALEKFHKNFAKFPEIFVNKSILRKIPWTKILFSKRADNQQHCKIVVQSVEAGDKMNHRLAKYYFLHDELLEYKSHFEFEFLLHMFWNSLRNQRHST